MAKLFTYMTYNEFGHFEHHFDRIFVIDVLRATTSMLAGLNAGIDKIRPVLSVEDALAEKERSGIGENGALRLAGERKGLKIDGFDYGNSPLEFAAIETGISLVMTTSNGTFALEKAFSTGAAVFLLAFTNMTAAANLVQKDENIAIVCAGSHNETSLEDLLCAGVFINKLEGRSDYAFNDQSLIAAGYVNQVLHERSADAIFRVVSRSHHAAHLRRLNAGKDIEYACQIDLVTINAVLENGWIKKADNGI